MAVNPYVPTKFTGQDGTGLGRPRKTDGGTGFAEDDHRVIREYTAEADITVGDVLTFGAVAGEVVTTTTAGDFVAGIALETVLEGERVLTCVEGFTEVADTTVAAGTVVGADLAALATGPILIVTAAGAAQYVFVTQGAG